MCFGFIYYLLAISFSNYKGRFRYLSIQSVAKAAAHFVSHVRCFFIKKDPYTISGIEIFGLPS